MSKRNRTPRRPYSLAEIEVIKAKTTLSTHEAAAIAGISNSTLWLKMQDGTGPHRRRTSLSPSLVIDLTLVEFYCFHPQF